MLDDATPPPPDRAIVAEPSPPGGRSWLRPASTWALAAFWLTLFTATHIPRVRRELTPALSDKWQHYVAYALLGGLLAFWWSLRRPLTWRAGLTLFCAAGLYGAFDEATQPLFGRDAELLDWRSDVIGLATGILVVAFGRGLLRRWRPS